MATSRSQALINAPPSRVWDLVGDPRRHPEWWPRVIEVSGERFAEGDNYGQVTRDLTGEVTTMMCIERLEDLREIQMRCAKTGMFARWRLTEARGDTFIDAEFGMEPTGAAGRVFDATLGRLYFRRWLEQSLKALEAAAVRRGEPC